MKVITIKQPWASLIINGYKKYEFRGWSTKVRGIVLIHASKSYDKKLIDRFSGLKLNYPVGSIIGSVVITDCIEIDKEFEDYLIQENELVYGHHHGRSGYAFKMDEAIKFDVPITAKGKLGFWNYNDDILNDK